MGADGDAVAGVIGQCTGHGDGIGAAAQVGVISGQRAAIGQVAGDCELALLLQIQGAGVGEGAGLHVQCATVHRDGVGVGIRAIRRQVESGAFVDGDRAGVLQAELSAVVRV